MFTLANCTPRSPAYRIGIPFAHMKNGDFEAISVNERHSMRRVDLESGASHIGKVPHFIE